MKKIRDIGFVLCVLAVASCGGAHSKASPDSDAERLGAQAAAAVIATDHADTMALQQAILEAKAIQSQWVMKGDSAAVRDFEEGFAQHLMANDISLYHAIFPHRQ
jgi:hypothetical protein